MKTCSKCRLLKKEDQFNKSSRSKDGLHSYCRECSKAHYQGNSVRHKGNVKNTRLRYFEKARELAVSYLSKGCLDCGNMDIRVLDFDHVRGIKASNVSTMIQRQVPLDIVQSEIDKCEIRCKNCHAIKTITRLGSSWHDNFMPS